MSRTYPPDFPDKISFSPKQRRRFFWLIGGAVFVLIVFTSAGTVAQFYLDRLWFDHLGFGQRFWREINFRATITLIAALAAALPLWLTINWLWRALPDSDPDIEIIEPGHDSSDLAQRIASAQLSVVRGALGYGRWLIALIAGGFAAYTADTQWDTVMLWWYRQPMNQQDGIYGRDISYYLFTYPLEQLVVNTAVVMVILALIILLLVSVWARLPRLGPLSGGLTGYGRLQLRLVRLWGVWAAFGLGLLAWRHLLARIGLLYTEHQSFIGIDFVGAHWWRHIEYLLAVLAMLAGLVGLGVALAPRLSSLRRIGAGAIATYIVCLILAFIIAGLYWALRVRPNELDSERPYIAVSINGTRQAFGLDKFHEHEFVPAPENPAAVAAQRQALSDVRLWDQGALKAQLKQQQASRPYYDFPGIDVDRYMIDGQVKSVMVATREIVLPPSIQTWTNERFIYTHGYGVTMNSVNSFTPQGGPELILENMPVNSATPSLKVTRPEIYFGEKTTEHVYVHTTQPEFDYPVGQENSTTSYQGPGGIPIYGTAARLAAAIALGDGAQLLLSNYLTPESQLLYRRAITERVSAVAPFLTLDRDPYIVVTDDGRLKFIIDAYTSSSNYPEATNITLYDTPVTYTRNSVKAVVDAYDGSVTLYVMDEQDPIIRAYRQFWPDIFQPASSISANLRAHLRYPESLMLVQAEIYRAYHMTDPQVFYNREDVWEIAKQRKQQGSDNNGTDEYMMPYYVEAALTQGGQPEFVQILPFTPSTRDTLIGWMAAGCDPANYGQVYVYRFPKGRYTIGPLQVEAHIDQDPHLSPTLSLWNQQGSKVLRGDIIALPVANQMIYVEPIYIKAQSASSMPQLGLVVIALENSLFYGSTFQEAFSNLANGAPAAATAANTSGEPGQTTAGQPTQNQSALPSQASGGGNGGATDAAGLAKSAEDHLRNYERATGEGRYTDAGRELDALKSDLDKLVKLRK